MSHITKEEYLSAFLDDESGSFEQQRLSNQLAVDDLMKEKLVSFSLIGESMRHQAQPLIATPSFLASIQNEIKEDQCIVDTSAAMVSTTDTMIKKERFFSHQVIGYAVAASLVVIATVSVKNHLPPQSDEFTLHKHSPEPVLAKASVIDERVSGHTQQQESSISYTYPDAEVRDLLDQYVAHHLQYASASTLMPSVRAVSYSTDF